MIYLALTSFLVFYAVYSLVSILAAMFYKVPNYKDSVVANHKVLVFYPAYKPSPSFLKNMKYMKEQISGLDSKIYVLSQEGKDEINEEIQKYADFYDSKAFLQLPGNSYHHALEFAVGRIQEFFFSENEKFDSILILDPDNTMNSESISRLIEGRKSGAHVVLSKRASIDSDGATKLFDGLSERLNDYMFRRAKNVLGLIPELSGSGMLMKTELFTKAVLKLDKIAPGMDKQLLINMMFECDDLNILFDEKAVVYDEKTEDTDAFNRQRLRWFGNQYYNAKKFSLQLLTSGRIGLMDYAIVLCRPPRSFQIAGSLVFFPFDILLYYFGFIAFPMVATSFMIFGSSIALFLFKEGVLSKSLSLIIPTLKTSLVNGFTASKSLSSKNKNTFIHTRKDH